MGIIWIRRDSQRNGSFNGVPAAMKTSVAGLRSGGDDIDKSGGTRGNEDSLPRDAMRKSRRPASLCLSICHIRVVFRNG